MSMSAHPTSSRSKGLGLLPPVLRLAVVFLLGMFYIFVNDLITAAFILLIGIIVYFTSCGENKKTAWAAVLPGVMLLFYNLILMQ